VCDGAQLVLSIAFVVRLQEENIGDSPEILSNQETQRLSEAALLITL
jgi:hypothetical protein